MSDRPFFTAPDANLYPYTPPPPASTGKNVHNIAPPKENLRTRLGNAVSRIECLADQVTRYNDCLFNAPTSGAPVAVDTTTTQPPVIEHYVYRIHAELDRLENQLDRMETGL